MRLKEQLRRLSTEQSQNADNLVNVIIQVGFAREYHEALTKSEAQRLLKKHPDTAWIEGSEEERPTEHFPKLPEGKRLA